MIISQCLVESEVLICYHDECVSSYILEILLFWCIFYI